MKMILYTLTFDFNASHKLYNLAWSKSKNCEIFGLCANENFHGHNFKLEVTVQGEPALDSGLSVHRAWIQEVVSQQIIEKIDYKNLNTEVDFMREKLTSCENLVVGIWKLLAPEVKNNPYGNACSLYALNLIETTKNSVQYYGK